MLEKMHKMCIALAGAEAMHRMAHLESARLSIGQSPFQQADPMDVPIHSAGLPSIQAFDSMSLTSSSVVLKGCDISPSQGSTPALGNS
jgi:hypothetical protein